MPTLVLEVALAVLAAAVGAALALERTELWEPRPAVTVALVVLTAVLAAASTTSTAVRRFRARRRGARRDLLDDVLTGTLWAVADTTALDPRDLSVAAYRLDALPWRAPRLARLHRVRAARRPGATGIVWAPGKGVIGECVASGLVVARDVRATWAGLGTPDRAAWDALPPDTRSGVTHAEFLAVRDTVDVVVALPVVDDTGPTSRVTGCLALDGPTGSLQTLTTPAVLGLLEATTRVLRGLDVAAPQAVARSAGPGASTSPQDALTAAWRRAGLPPERVERLLHGR
ncbi:hypothetical protein [Kineococcus rubinsiae]|uniref:hypothetical protein n=1 Tax=Kineococcus rubinsiae TaxID=2609562 RepID=UPI00142F4235|nr:hypothetical protein [Kineococcus rubinsiae]NIZ90911.1 hypothetical protein [Kineococcus rubinsiae]